MKHDGGVRFLNILRFKKSVMGAMYAICKGVLKCFYQGVFFHDLLKPGTQRIKYIQPVFPRINLTPQLPTFP